MGVVGEGDPRETLVDFAGSGERIAELFHVEQSVEMLSSGNKGIPWDAQFALPFCSS